MSLDNALIIFVKYPQAGLVKRRLARSIGEKNAACLYRTFAETIIKNIQGKSFKRIIFYTPRQKQRQIKQWLGDNIELSPQIGRNLGERLSNAFKSTFQVGAKKIVVIGTDSPLLEKKIILQAFEKLAYNDCVIGPSVDCGYYLLGLSKFYKQLFQGIDWGTDRVFKQTVSSLKKLNLKFSLLEEHFDVDDLDDLIMLHRHSKPEKCVN